MTMTADTMTIDTVLSDEILAHCAEQAALYDHDQRFFEAGAGAIHDLHQYQSKEEPTMTHFLEHVTPPWLSRD